MLLQRLQVGFLRFLPGFSGFCPNCDCLGFRMARDPGVIRQIDNERATWHRFARCGFSSE
jgi:hypothetical protein